MVVRGLAWLLDHGGAQCGVLLGWDYRPAPGKTNQAHANTANQHIVHIFKVEISSKIRRKYVIIVNTIIMVSDIQTLPLISACDF